MKNPSSSQDACQDKLSVCPFRVSARHALNTHVKPTSFNTMPHGALPELMALDKIVGQGAPHLQARVVCEVSVAAGHRFPVHAITLGTADPLAPAVGFFGGVHGMERIGAQVVIAFLQHVVMRLRWDQTLTRLLG